MQVHEAVRDAPSFLRNAAEIAARDPINPETLYMWDNQVTAIEGFLADTEDFNGQNPELSKMRLELFGLKKQIEAKVLGFELKQENQEVPPEPTEEEQLADMVEYGKEIQRLVRDLMKAQPKTLKDLQEMEDPRLQLNNFIVETEPLKGKNKAIDAQRSAAKKCRADLETKVAAVIKAAAQADAASGDDDD